MNKTYLKYYILIYLSLFFITKNNFCFFFIFYFFIAFLTFLIVKNFKKFDNNNLLVIFFIILLIKFLFIFKIPILSDDIYRYLWEGKVVNYGFNPYIFPPDSKVLVPLRDKIFHLINHKELPAIYPPFMIIFNSIIVKLCYSVKFYKFILFIFDLLSFGLIILTCYELNINLRYSLLYLICPLTTIEIEWNGHNDIIMIFFFLLALYFFIKNKHLPSVISYALSVLSKFVYIIFAKEFLKNKNSILIFLFIIAIFYIIFIVSGINIFYSLGVYLKNWEFNGSLYKIVKIFINDQIKTRLILFFIFLCLWIYANLKLKKLTKRLLFIGIAFIIVSPTVHPWYGLWILPFVVLDFSFELYIFLLLLPFSYYVLIDYFNSGIWKENTLITSIIYLPVIYFYLKFFYYNKKILIFFTREK